MTSIGAAIIDQQLNMATEAAKGRRGTDAMTSVARATCRCTRR